MALAWIKLFTLVCIIGIMGYVLHWLMTSSRNSEATRDRRRTFFQPDDDDDDDDDD